MPNPVDIEAERVAFEATFCIPEHGWPSTRENEVYTDYHTDKLWQGWLARAAH